MIHQRGRPRETGAIWRKCRSIRGACLYTQLPLCGVVPVIGNLQSDNNDKRSEIMPRETDSLEIFLVQWRQSKSHQVASEPDSSLSICGHIETIYVRCKRCLYEWSAHSGNQPGHFEEAVGRVNLYCPSCGQDSIVPALLLK